MDAVGNGEGFRKEDRCKKVVGKEWYGKQWDFGIYRVKLQVFFCYI